MTCNFVSFETLVGYGVSEKYLKNAIKNYRQSKSLSWANIKDPKDKRRVLIDLDSIPEGTRKKYGIPTSVEYTEFQRIEQHKQLQKEKELKESTDKLALIYAFQNEWVEYYQMYFERLAHRPKTQQQRAVLFARTHAFWLKMVELTGSKFKADWGKPKHGFALYNDLRNDLDLKQIESLNYFTRKLREIRESLAKGLSIMDLIVGNNSNPRDNKKTNDFHQALVLTFLSHEKKYAYRVVTDLVNHHCEQEGQPAISESWIKQLMTENNEFRTLVDSYRNGDKFMNDNVLPYTTREITPYPGNVWMIDGSPIQFYCWNESRIKIVRLNLFVIIDVCSKKIVGMDVSYSEDRYNVMNALKMAVTNEGHLPSEIVSDNFSATKTEEIKEIQSQMERMQIVWRYSKVGNPQDKSQVERFFGAFQSVECSLYDDYIGEGITSKRLNARPSPEFLLNITKEKGVPTYEEMVNRIVTMVAKHNERKTTKKQSPNEIYKKLPKPNVKELDALKTSLMFWKKTTHTVKRGMVKITVRKTDYSYEIHHHDLKMRLQNKKVIIRYDENDLDIIMLFDQYDNVLCECQKSIKVNIATVDRTQADEENTSKVVAKKESYKNHLQKKKASVIDKGLKVVNKDTLNLVHPLSLSKNQINTKESEEFIDEFLRVKGISSDKIKRTQEYAPLTTIAQKSVAVNIEEKLLQTKEPSGKGSLKPVGESN